MEDLGLKGKGGRRVRKARRAMKGFLVLYS